MLAILLRQFGVAIVDDALDTPVDLRYLSGIPDEARSWPAFRAAAYFPAD